MSPPTPFKSYTLDELDHLDLPEPEWLVDDLLVRARLTLFSAREKSGKSLVVIDLACSVGLGETFLGRATRQGVALYCPAEDNLGDVRRRLQVRTPPDSPSGAVHVLPLNGWIEGNELRLDRADSLVRLRAKIEELRPSLVVLDPLRELHHLHEDVADDMAPMIRDLRLMAHQTNAAIVLVHHMGKGGTSRGSTAITGSVDEIWEYDGTEGEEAA